MNEQTLAAAGTGTSNKNRSRIDHHGGGDENNSDGSGDRSDSEEVDKPSPSLPSSPVQFSGMNVSSEGRKRKRPDRPSAASLSTSKRSLSLGFGNFKGVTLLDVTNNNYLRKGSEKTYWTEEQVVEPRKCSNVMLEARCASLHLH